LLIDRTRGWKEYDGRSLRVQRHGDSHVVENDSESLAEVRLTERLHTSLLAKSEWLAGCERLSDSLTAENDGESLAKVRLSERQDSSLLAKYYT
jgi:hypothetical protein